MLEVYLDLMVLLNTAVDLLLMAAANRLTGFPTSWPRVLPAAVLGGCYSGACLLQGFRFLGGLLWRLVSLGLMAVLAFGWNRSVWKRCAVFVLLTMTLGGVAASLGKPTVVTLILCCGGLWLLCVLGVGDGLGKREYVPVTLRVGDSVCSVIALRDTGNTLRDPITGEQVLVVSAAVGQRLTGLTRQQLESPLETVSQVPELRLRLIPYRAVGNGNGMLLGMRVEEVQIGSRRGSTVVAFAPEGIGEGEFHQALVAAG